MRLPRFRFTVRRMLVAVATMAVVLWSLRGHGDPVSRRNYDKIQVGMMRAEVLELMGGPGLELVPMWYDEIHFEEHRDLLLRTFPHTSGNWRKNSHMIGVMFGRNDRVVGKSFSRDPNVGILRRVIDWIGL